MGMAAVAASSIFLSDRLVRATFINSTRSLLAGTKLVTSAFKPICAFILVTRCHRKPASSSDSSSATVKCFAICPALFPVADHASAPLTLIQKLRAERESCRLSTETGGVRKQLWSVLISPCKVGVIAEKMPASLHNGKYNELVRSGFCRRNVASSSTNSHPVKPVRVMNSLLF